VRGRVDLAGTWGLTWTEGGHGPQSAADFVRQRPRDPGRYLQVPVPMELHRVFLRMGLIEDPNLGTNSLKARWVSEQYYQYHRLFDAPPDVATGRAWLVFDQLDLAATIFLNGELVGRHENAHRPCRIDVSGKVKAGSNELLVAVESGLYAVADREGGAYGHQLDSALNKRHWLRKAQYQFLWDWNPRLVNVGITGPVALEWGSVARLDQVAVWAEPSADFASAKVTVRAFIEGLKPGAAATVQVRIRETGQTAQKEVALPDGITLHSVDVALSKPRLWWPRGHGEPALYTAEVAVVAGGETIGTALRRFGVRRIELDRSPHPEVGEYFAIKVNGRRIFCKGGNWVPPDMIPSSVTRERLARLVQQAIDANFNLLRIWGGGIYAGHDLLELCDETGLLVWHDLLFACIKYPADHPEFLDEIRREVTWAVREHAHHPSLAVWCGNNELEWAAFDWGYDRFGKTFPDYALFHHAIPVILREEDPLRPYWPSSPFSPGNQKPNDPTVGDQHPWATTLGADGADFWAYRRYVDRFPNEGGVLGASSPATLAQFLPEGERRLRSFTWEHHDNAANFWNEDPGVTYRLVDLWLGKDAAKMTYEDYVFGSALIQAEGLSEYISNYRRRMFSSSSAIFWMYNDSWPVTHGWTIVDYYGRRKLAYHPVRRAFEPVSVVAVDEGGAVTVYGVNDTPDEWRGRVRYGLFDLAGGLPKDEAKDVVLAPNASTPLASFDRKEWERRGLARHGAFAVLEDAQGKTAAQHRLLVTRFKDLQWSAPRIEMSREGEHLELRSSAFVWGVTLDVNGEDAVADDCFDLIPGIAYRIPWPGAKPLPEVQRTGNALFLAPAVPPRASGG
jgi:beta-mannosidase